MGDKIWIAFPGGGTIPGSVLDEDRDRKVPPKEPVLVPKVYCDHLIHDRFAVEANEPKRTEMAGRKGKKAAIEAAEKAVADAKALVEAAGTDMVAKQAADDKLKVAEADLLALKA